PRESDFYPDSIRVRLDPAFVAPFTAVKQTGPKSAIQFGVAGWTAPNTPVPQGGGVLREVPGWFALGFAIVWGVLVRRGAGVRPGRGGGALSGRRRGERRGRRRGRLPRRRARAGQRARRRAGRADPRKEPQGPDEARGSPADGLSRAGLAALPADPRAARPTR